MPKSDRKCILFSTTSSSEKHHKDPFTPAIYNMWTIVWSEIAKKKMGTQPILELFSSGKSAHNHRSKCAHLVQYNPFINNKFTQ